jgi:hypothetical protein
MKSRANDQSLVRSLPREDAGKSAHGHTPPRQEITFKILLRIEEREMPGHTAALIAGPNVCQKNGEIRGEPFSVFHILGPYLLRGRSACPGISRSSLTLAPLGSILYASAGAPQNLERDLPPRKLRVRTLSRESTPPNSKTTRQDAPGRTISR